MTATGLYSLPLVAAKTPESSLPRDLEGACRALEKEFARLVFQKMRTALVASPSGPTSGFAREATQGMLDEQWAELASRGEGLGLWRAMVAQLGGEEVKSSGSAADEKTRVRMGPTEEDPRAQGGAKKAGLPLEASSRVRRLPRAGYEDGGRSLTPRKDREGI